MKQTLISAILIIICQSAYPGEPWNNAKAVLRSEFIWKTGDIAAPSCHASTIVTTENGLLASWFAGSQEGAKDVGIWVSRFSEGKWSTPVEVANGVMNKLMRHPCWNPVLYNTGSKILLFYKTGPSPAAWWGMLMTSDDNGNTWDEPVRLPKNILGPVKNKPVLLENGELLCPSSTENDGWRIHMEFTSDYGQTWERTAALNEKTTGAIQPTILILRGGRIQTLCRSTSGRILTSESIDNGYSWSTLNETSLPNPNSGIDAVTLKDGRHLLVYNHLKEGRNMLNIAISEDGQIWKAAGILENDMKGTEFSYPAVIQAEDGMVHITYTWKRMLIRHVVIDPSMIVTKDFSQGEWPESE